MGPTVCELEGPIPILKRSKTLIAKGHLPEVENLRYFMLFILPAHDLPSTGNGTGGARLFYNPGRLDIYLI